MEKKKICNEVRTSNVHTEILLLPLSAYLLLNQLFRFHRIKRSFSIGIQINFRLYFYYNSKEEGNYFNCKRQHIISIEKMFQ